MEYPAAVHLRGEAVFHRGRVQLTVHVFRGHRQVHEPHAYGLAEALDHAALDLALVHERVEDRSHVVGTHQLAHAHLPRLPVDCHLRRLDADGGGARPFVASVTACRLDHLPAAGDEFGQNIAWPSFAVIRPSWSRSSS